jgi:glycosyltransferase involved in cell wall biosynthesis
MQKISLIIPMKNEQEVIQPLFNKLNQVLAKLVEMDYEIIVINDGSTDNTLAALLELKAADPRLKIVDFSRNFGKESAVYAGFYYATGDCAVTLDADLQDPPELVLAMVKKWQEGYEVVTAVRNSRDSDSWLKRQTAKWFYALINKISEVKLTPNAGDYRLLDRLALNAFLALPERARFNKGLFSWLGFKEYKLFHKRDLRVSGSSKWNYLKLFNFAIDGITSFSIAPLRIWTYAGFLTSLGAFLYGIYYLIKTFCYGVDVHGYPSLLIFILFFSGLQMIGIGMLGEYLGRIFIEAKQRPLYIVRKFYA